jgi:hypothetical protein
MKHDKMPPMARDFIGMENIVRYVLQLLSMKKRHPMATYFTPLAIFLKKG